MRSRRVEIRARRRRQGPADRETGQRGSRDACRTHGQDDRRAERQRDYGVEDRDAMNRQLSNSPILKLSNYSIALSNWIAANTFPSGSLKNVSAPTPTMIDRGSTMVPPLARTAFSVASIDSTDIVHS